MSCNWRVIILLEVNLLPFPLDDLLANFYSHFPPSYYGDTNTQLPFCKAHTTSRVCPRSSQVGFCGRGADRSDNSKVAGRERPSLQRQGHRCSESECHETPSDQLLLAKGRWAVRRDMRECPCRQHSPGAERPGHYWQNDCLRIQKKQVRLLQTRILRWPTF